MEQNIIQITLEPSEFLYLLRTLGATTIFGADNQDLFPKEKQIEDSLLAQGLQALKEHGWLRPVEEPNQWDMNSGLMLVAATVADPELVLITTHYLNKEQKQVVTHYLAGELIVEQVVLEDGRYRLEVLPNLSILLERLAFTLNIAERQNQREVESITIDTSLFSQLGQLVKADQLDQARILLEEIDLSPKAKQQIITLLSNARRIADIEIGRTFGRQLLGKYEPILLETNETLWIARADDTDSKLLLEFAHRELFMTLMTKYTKELSKIQPKAKETV